MKRFSERKGIHPIAVDLQITGMSADLRNSLWNVLNIWLWESQNFMSVQHGDPLVILFARFLWFKFFKRPVDEIPDNRYQIVPAVKKYFFSCGWNEVYDFIEFVVSMPLGEGLQQQFNDVLESELAGYRFIDGVLADVTSEQEVEALQEALADDRFGAVGAHLRRALELLSDRKAPDYRNSIKESVSAVESMAKIIAGQEKATLGDALRVVLRDSAFHHV